MSANPLIDVNLATLASLGDGLFAELSALREHDPLAWSPASHCWIVTGHEHIMEGFSGTLPLSSHHLPEMLYQVIPEQEFKTRMPNTLKYQCQILPNLDGDRHLHIRKLLVKALNKKLVESLRPFVRERVATLLDMAAAKRELEFNETIARQLPGSVILRLLGISDTPMDKLKWWTDATTLALTTFNPKAEWLDGLEIVVTDMLQVFQAVIEERRIKPRVDLTTEMLNAVEGSDRLTMEEMIAAMMLIVVAGHDTTLNSMSLGLRALSRNPAPWAQWRAQPERGQEFGIELMRYVAMATALPRVVSQDFIWHGRQLRKNELVMLMMAGGNRDPAVYQQPNKMDLARPNDASLTFGPGLHHCIGHLLAKMQIDEFFTALTQRFDRVELLEEPEFVPNLVFRGLQKMNVRFHPRSD